MKIKLIFAAITLALVLSLGATIWAINQLAEKVEDGGLKSVVTHLWCGKDKDCHL